MSRLVEPARATAEDLGEGTPPGKATLWITDGNRTNLSGILVYASEEDAIRAMPGKLFEYKGVEAVVNYKEPDESYLSVWVLKREARWPKRQPFDWGKLWKFLGG